MAHAAGVRQPCLHLWVEDGGDTMQLRMGCPAIGLMIRVGILAVALVSLAACHTEIAVRATTRAIAEAATVPSPPERALALQFSIETPSADACRKLASAVPQRAKVYGLQAADAKCENSGSEHSVEFSSDVRLVVTPNNSSALNEPVQGDVLFRAFITTFTHVMRERRLGRGYALTLLYNQPLFASLQADLMKEDPTERFDLSDMRLSLDLRNDLTSKEVVQISSAFVGPEPIVHSTSFVLAPQQSTNATFSDVAVADFAKRGHMTVVSFYPAD
jgi:hypothetical protein